ncbi:MAG: molybdate ABC transporter substrate-binding protein [Candidatus Muiribacteriota bacterium]
MINFFSDKNNLHTSLFLIVIIIFFLILYSMFGIFKGNGKNSLTISAASSLTDFMENAKDEFEKIYPEVEIILNLGPSGHLQHQIQHGAPVDVFFPAAPVHMDRLEKKDLINSSSRINVFGNDMVLITHKDFEMNNFNDLLKDDIKNIGVGNPDSVPAGAYAKKMLEKLNLWSKVERKLVKGHNVRTVLSYVETKNAQAGFVYKTDALISDSVKIIKKTPTDIDLNIVYPAAVLLNSNNKELADDFMSFLQSEKIDSLIEKFGFDKI